MIVCNRLTNVHLGGKGEWKQGRRVTFSSLSACVLGNYEAETFSIKYVLKGTEHYVLNRKTYTVREGEFLVVNRHHAVEAFIRSKEKALGLCIHLDAALLQRAYAAQAFTQGQLLEAPCQGLPVPEVQPLIYGANENAMGGFLQRAGRLLNQSEAVLHLHEEGFYQALADGFVRLQNRCKAPALATRSAVQQELADRLRRAKEVMDDAGDEKLGMAAVAQEALLSIPHFFRLFKRAYGVAPYRYLLNKKLERAHLLLKENRQSVTEVAYRFGFADAASFSKAYKKRYGFSPNKALLA